MVKIMIKDKFKIKKEERGTHWLILHVGGAGGENGVLFNCQGKDIV